MSESSVIGTHLFVYKETDKLSYPQKCKIPPSLARFPATSCVIVKSENKRKFLCRLFYLNNVYNHKEVSYLDQSVEIEPIHKDTRVITYIKEIQHIPAVELNNFKNVRVKLNVNAAELNLDVIKTADDLNKVALSILKHYMFSKDCMITCRRTGISRIYVHDTDLPGFGNITDEASITVEEIELEHSYRCAHELGGIKDVEMALSSVIFDNQNYLKNFKTCPLKPQCQVLLHGPCGSGKTSLIHHLARQHKCNVFEITGDIFKPYPGETEEELERIFSRIKTVTQLIPSNLSIILIENVEVFCPKFDLKLRESSHSSRIASLIYAQLDEIASNAKGILVIGTSSKIESVNIALRRASRLGIELALDMPNETQRCEIVKILAMSMLGHLELNDIDKLSGFVAEHTTGFVGADLEVLCQYVLRQHKLRSQDNIYHLFESGLKSINPSVMRDNLGLVTRSTMKLSDIGGMEEVKKSLLTCILGPLKQPDKFQRFGLRSPSGILFYGPSGCAKTTIVKCLAGESKMTLISVSSAEIYSPYVGEAEKFIVKLFNQARMSAPAILFFDEIDTIVGSRSQSGNNNNDAHMRILSTLLTEIDGFGGGGAVSGKYKPIMIIGATNRPECIDDALMRPGRFDKLIHIPAPDYDYRLEILQFQLRDMPIADDVNVRDIAERTEFFSGADLVNLCNEAAICAATRDINCDIIAADDFENVLTFLRPSLDEKKIKFYEMFEKRSTSINKG